MVHPLRGKRRGVIPTFFDKGRGPECGFLLMQNILLERIVLSFWEIQEKHEQISAKSKHSTKKVEKSRVLSAFKGLNFL